MTTSSPTAKSAAPATAAINVQLVGGPTAIVEIGGIRLLIDPAFDPPGDHPVGNRTLVKTDYPAIVPDEVGDIDAVLLSHDQHPDNLDNAGREMLKRMPLVLTTASAVHRLGGQTRELPVWHSQVLPRPDGGELTITGVPAQHGPADTEHITGEVRGFVLSGDGLPTVYVSGDNASLAIVNEVADQAGPFDVAVLFAGRARTPMMDAYLTLSSDQAARAAAVLGSPTVIPVHVEGWKHFTENTDAVAAAFARHGLDDLLLLPAPGVPTTVPVRPRP
jgi:L-ascorbate metabolism protein UlaG (beta-lactamase superfamily)